MARAFVVMVDLHARVCVLAVVSDHLCVCGGLWVRGLRMHGVFGLCALQCFCIVMLHCVVVLSCVHAMWGCAEIQPTITLFDNAPIPLLPPPHHACVLHHCTLFFLSLGCFVHFEMLLDGAVYGRGGATVLHAYCLRVVG
jgi:hypothetical protein